MNLISKEDLGILLEYEYGIKATLIDKSAWGFTSTAYYVRDGANRQYIAKVAMVSEEKLAKSQKDILLSTLLHGVVNTPNYLRNSQGEYLTVGKELLLKVADYIEGTAPFDMNTKILEQMAITLKKIHCFPLADVNYELRGYESVLQGIDVKGSETKLLHGDFTPSNVIVADNVIKGVIDMEDSLTGPVEYDLAVSAVFGWFRMKNIPFTKALDSVKNAYDGKVSQSLLNTFAVEHTRRYLNHVKNSKENYKDESNWQDDFNFAQKAFETISQSVS